MVQQAIRRSLCALLVATCHGMAANAQCTGDINGDFSVDGKDISYILSAWGPCGAEDCRADLTGDGQVNGVDLSALLAAWGYCPVVVPSWATLIESYPDPAVVTNPALRDAIVATGHAWRVRHTQTQIEMVLIPSGPFVMGCVSGSPGCVNNNVVGSGASWPHEVELTDSFYLGRHEVTQAQWTAVMGSNPSFHQEPDFPNTEDRPVERVSWLGVQGFLAATGLRLPTEAEWEYSARAGTTTRYHGFPGVPEGTDDAELLNLIRWGPSNSGGQTQPVARLLPNGFGLFDMLGNVWEWNNDVSDQSYYRWSPRVNPPGASVGWDCYLVLRSLRGGSSVGGVAHIAFRAGNWQQSPGSFLGFRVARSVDRVTLLGVSPVSGSPAGGTLVALTGTNMGGVTSVSFGGAAATEVKVVSPTKVTARTPPGAAGVCEVSLNGATGSASIPNAFSYASAKVPGWAELVEPLPDPAFVIQQSLRDAIDATGLAWRVRDSATGVEMVLIPPGSFTMGCGTPGSDACVPEWTAHLVTLTSPFYLARYEVTQTQWERVMGYNPSPCGSNGFDCGGEDETPCPPASSLPVAWLYWFQAAEFCTRTGMRLPTEAEWEYSYRAGTTTRFHGFPLAPEGFDDPFMQQPQFSRYKAIAWSHLNSEFVVQPIGLKAANGFGIHDMAGNVYEWVADWYGPYSGDPQIDPVGPDLGTHKVVRGGAVWGYSDQHGAYIRLWSDPTDTLSGTGLRPARNP